VIQRVTISLFAAVMVLAAACGQSSEERIKQADYHYKLATNFFYDQNTQSAITDLYECIKLNPRHAQAHHLLGFIYFGRQDYVRAHEEFQAAITVDPEFDEAVANLGNLYLATEQWEMAVPYFERLLDRPLYKTPYLAQNNLGWALYKLGRFEEAQRHIGMAIFLNPKFCLAYNNKGRIFAHLGDTAAALEAFNKAIELCPAYAEPHYFLGRIYAALSAADRAKTHFTRCHELGPDTPYGRRCGDAL
jgi:type IV pilus assembly protein PilF